MADEWDKLEQDFKKLDAKLKQTNLDGATKLWKALLARDKLLDDHEKAMQKAAVTAYEGGIKNKTLAEFLKDKPFADAKKLLDGDRKALVEELKALNTYCLDCDALAKVGDKLDDTMAKAIKADKGGSTGQKKIAKLRDELTATVRELNQGAALRFRPEKYLTAFDAQYDKLIDHLLVVAMKKAKETTDDGEIPVPLSDAKTKARMADMTDIDKRIDKLCKDALAAAADKNPKKAMKLLETAQFQLAALQKIYGEFGKLTTKFKEEIAKSKDKEAVKKSSVEIKKLADGAKAACLATKTKIEETFADEADESDYLGLGKLFKE